MISSDQYRLEFIPLSNLNFILTIIVINSVAWMNLFRKNISLNDDKICSIKYEVNICYCQRAWGCKFDQICLMRLDVLNQYFNGAYIAIPTEFFAIGSTYWTNVRKQVVIMKRLGSARCAILNWRKTISFDLQPPESETSKRHFDFNSFCGWSSTARDRRLFGSYKD